MPNQVWWAACHLVHWLWGIILLNANYGRHGTQSGAYVCLLLLPISRPGLLDMAGATNTNHPYGPLGHGRHSLTSHVSFMQHGLLDLAVVGLLCALGLCSSCSLACGIRQAVAYLCTIGTDLAAWPIGFGRLFHTCALGLP